ncbi:MAG: PH domain-containing protein [Lachnospiraceae bacterium]|nr:PH domain-containing protein [Lachnospiraceae bacterium]
MYESRIRGMINPNEKILWESRPDIKCFILESIFNPLLPFAVLWGAIDLFALSQMMDMMDASIGFIFILLHMAPVWIYLLGVITTTMRHKKIEYIITDRAIYVSGGLITFNVEMKPLAELSHVNIHRGLFDQYLGVGDVNIICSHSNMSQTYNSGNHNAHHSLNICDIPDYENVFKLIQSLQTDIYSDTMYPNEYRPSSNPGYNTQYQGDATKYINR